MYKYICNYIHELLIPNVIFINSLKSKFLTKIDSVHDIFIQLQTLDTRLKSYINTVYINKEISDSEKLNKIIDIETDIKKIIQLILLKYENGLSEEKIIILRNILKYKDETGSNLN